MEPQNLEKAKEEARRSNWTQVLPISCYESEDEIPNAIPSSSQSHLNKNTEMPNWDDIMGEPQVSIDDDYTTAESNRLDEDDDDKTYEEEGRAMEMSEYGYVAERVGRILNTNRSDVKSLGDRKIQVDLSFIQGLASQNRIKQIIEDVIKKYTSIPGRVETDLSEIPGVYTFNVTNPYLSPRSVSSDDPTTSKDPQDDIESENQFANHELSESLMKGIALTPKVPGLPKKTIKYGDYGLIKEKLYKIIKDNPDKNNQEIIEIALRLSGDYKKVFNLYKY